MKFPTGDTLFTLRGFFNRGVGDTSRVPHDHFAHLLWFIVCSFLGGEFVHKVLHHHCTLGRARARTLERDGHTNIWNKDLLQMWYWCSTASKFPL